jgi:hypothetical protein
MSMAASALRVNRGVMGSPHISHARAELSEPPAGHDFLT